MIKDRAIIYLALGQIVVWSGLYYTFPALLLHWESDLAWSKVDITGAITLAIFLSAAASPFTGKLIDAGKGPLVLTASTLIGGASLFLLGYVETRFGFYLSWAIIGLSFSGCLYDPCFALVTRGRGQSAKQSIILITLIAGLASTITFPTVHALVEVLGWRQTVMIFAVFVATAGTALMWAGSKIMESNASGVIHPNKHSKTTRKSVIRSPVFLMLATGFGLAALVHGVTLQHLFPILHDRGITSDVAVIAASFIGPMQVAGRLAMMASQNQVSNHGVAISCFVVMGLSIMTLIASAWAPPLLVLFVVLFGGGYGMVSIIRPVIARDILGDSGFGSKFGVLSMFYLFGAASAPFLGSLVWKFGGYQFVLPCLLVLCVVGMLLYIKAYNLKQTLDP